MLKYGVGERGEGLRTSCSILWRVRQSAGEKEGRCGSMDSNGDGMLVLPLDSGRSSSEVDVCAVGVNGLAETGELG